MKRFVFLFILVLPVLAFAQTAEPDIMPADWIEFKNWIKTGQYSLSYKTLVSPTISGTATVTATWNTTGPITYSSDGDTLKLNLYQYLYPIDLEIGNSRVFSVDSSGNVTAATSFNPDAADGATLGTTALEFSDAYFADASVLSFGNDQDVTLTHVPDVGLTLNLALAATGGIDLATESTHIWAAGGSTVLATAGTDAACSDGDRYWVELMIPSNTTITGLSYLVGSVGGTDSVVVQLVNSAGTEVATSRPDGEAADIVGTAAQFQSVDFSTPYAATAGVYYAVVQFNGTTAKFRTYPIPGSKFVAGTAAGTWQTKADITPGTTFTADKGPIVMTY